MNILSHGIIHGDIVKLQDNPGLQEGQEVDVVLTTTPNAPRDCRYPPGKRALNWTEQDDQILAELYRLRHPMPGQGGR